MHRYLILSIAVIGAGFLVVFNLSQQEPLQDPEDYEYSAAIINSRDDGRDELNVFPFRASTAAIPLPFNLGTGGAFTRGQSVPATQLGKEFSTQGALPLAG